MIGSWSSSQNKMRSLGVTTKGSPKSVDRYMAYLSPLASIASPCAPTFFRGTQVAFQQEVLSPPRSFALTRSYKVGRSG